jgi:hypothetical protein
LDKRLRRIKRMKLEKGIFSNEEFLEMVRVVDQEMKSKKKEGLVNDSLCSFL